MVTTTTKKHEQLRELWGGDYYPDKFAPKLIKDGLPSSGILQKMLRITKFWKHVLHRSLPDLWEEGGPLNTHCGNCKTGKLTEPALVSAITQIEDEHEQERAAASSNNRRKPSTASSTQIREGGPIRGSDHYLPTPDKMDLDMDETDFSMTAHSDAARASFGTSQLAVLSSDALSQFPDRPSTIEDDVSEPVLGKEPDDPSFWDMFGASCPEDPHGESVDSFLTGDNMASLLTEPHVPEFPIMVQSPTDSVMDLINPDLDATTQISIVPSKLSSPLATPVKPLRLGGGADQTTVKDPTPARDPTPAILRRGLWLSQDDIYNCLQIHPQNPAWQVMFPGYPSLDQTTQILPKHRTVHATSLLFFLFVQQSHWVVGHWASVTQRFTLYDSLRSESHFDEVRNFMKSWLQSDDGGHAQFVQGVRFPMGHKVSQRNRGPLTVCRIAPSRMTQITVESTPSPSPSLS